MFYFVGYGLPSLIGKIDCAKSFLISLKMFNLYLEAFKTRYTNCIKS